jgi:toxin ParE1/3/4
MAQIVWSQRSLNHLEEIAEFIALDSPDFAAAFVTRIIDAIDRAALFPRLGRQVPEFEDDMLREIIFQNYRIVYRIDGDRLGVVAVRHAAMDLRAELERPHWDLR